MRIFPGTGKPGLPRNLVREPHEDMVYGQVVKEKEQGRVSGASDRMRCGKASPTEA
ncbi:hypothetical protein QUF80_17485 [Desulfococcaceae bacterium HSG8]|nr:hypothetical protein [Desulfococcaceae bacterium HSG8]